MSRSRLEVRAAWTTILRAAITTAESESIYGGTQGALSGPTPIVIVASVGSDRTGSGGRATFGGGTVPFFDLDVYLYALTTDAADDLLDTLEAEIAEAVAKNQQHPYWTAVSYRGPTEAKFLETHDGTSYKYEIVPLRFSGRS